MRPSTTPSRLRGVVTAAAAVVVASACSPFSLAPEFDEQLNVCPVPDKNFAALRLQPNALNLRVGSTARLQVTPVDAQGQFVLCSPPITWSTTDLSVATVPDGLVAGVAAGTATIHVTAGGKADSAKVTVVATTIGSVSIQRAPASLLVGQTAGLVLVTRDTDVATIRLIGHS